MISPRSCWQAILERAFEKGRLLRAERRERGTRARSRALTCFYQAGFALRWFRDNRDITALAHDHGVSRATGYRYLDEVIAVLAAHTPDLHEALQRAHDDGAGYVILDGKLFASDRPAEQTTSVKGKPIDAWYSGEAHEHGGDIQALSAPDGFPLWVKAYAHDLKDWFVFLRGRGLDWREVRLEDVGEFVAWVRLPPPARDGRVAVLPSVEPHCGAATVNRKLSAVSAFYQHAARHGVDLGELLTSWQPAGRRGTSWRPFLHHISKSQPAARRVIGMKVPRKHPRILTAAEMQAILDGCDRLRDRLLFAVLHDTGMRVGEALGPRHEDWAAAERTVAVLPRVNDNGARTKSAQPRTIPISAGLVRLYADYLHGEYGDLDSDYVFVNLWAGQHGHPWTYAAVYDLVTRLRRRTGIDFDPHWCRHTYATGLLRAGTPVEVVSRLLGHGSVTTTLEVYGHLSVADARQTLEQAGWFADSDTDGAVQL